MAGGTYRRWDWKRSVVLTALLAVALLAPAGAKASLITPQAAPTKPITPTAAPAPAAPQASSPAPADGSSDTGDDILSQRVPSSAGQDQSADDDILSQRGPSDPGNQGDDLLKERVPIAPNSFDGPSLFELVDSLLVLDGDPGIDLRGIDPNGFFDSDWLHPEIYAPELINRVGPVPGPDVDVGAVPLPDINDPVLINRVGPVPDACSKGETPEGHGKLCPN